MLDLPAKTKDPQNLPGIIDDAEAELIGPWNRSTNFKPHIGSGYIHDNNLGGGRSKAVFRCTASESGAYELLMAYSAHETRARSVPVTVTSGGNERQITVDQTQPLPLGKLFRSVGKLQLEAGVETLISISNRGTNGFVIVDALRVIPVQE